MLKLGVKDEGDCSISNDEQISDIRYQFDKSKQLVFAS